MLLVFLSVTSLALLGAALGQEEGVGLLITDMVADPKPLLNVSIVNENDLLGTTALQCRTNATPADPNDQDVGEWISPDGSAISISSSEPVYVLRLPMEVNLFLKGQLLPPWHGVYTCQIADSDMNIQTLYAGIYSAEDYDDGAPRISSSPSFQLLTPFSQFPPSFSLTCTSTMFPPTYVSWSRNGPEVILGEFFQTNQILRDPANTTFDNILLVNGDLPGEFSCNVSNSRNSNNATLVVQVPDGPPENITEEFLGLGNVRISWFRPSSGPVFGYQLFYRRVSPELGEEMTVNVTDPDVTNTTLHHLESGAEYNVSMLAYAHLPVERSPFIRFQLSVAGIPENVSVIAISPTSLSVTWDPPLEGQAVRYNVSYTPTEQGCGLEMITTSFDVEETAFNITGLEEDQEYSVEVTTISQAAAGDPAPAVNQTTSITNPSGPPTNVVATATNPLTVNVSWEPPECRDQNGPITNYSVGYIGQDPLSTEMGLNTSFILPVSFRHYDVVVAAMNAEGIGNYSDAIDIVVIDIPGPVVSFTVTSSDFTSLVLNWEPPSVDEEFYQSFNYSLQWFFATSESAQAPADLPADQVGNLLVVMQLEAEIESLQPNVSYWFYITAISSEGMGEEMVGATGTTLLIGQVSGLQVQQMNLSSVNVSWTSLSSGDVTYYSIFYNSTEVSEEDGLFVAGEENVTGSTRFLIVNGLDSNLDYVFLMAAVVTTKESTILGPLSEEVEFSFTSEGINPTILIIVFSVAGGILIFIVVIIITLMFLRILNRSIGPVETVKEDVDILLRPLDRGQVLLGSAEPSAIGRPTLVGGEPGDVHAIEGQEVVLRVPITGNPTPKVTWSHNKADITAESRGNGIVFLEDEGVIVFPHVEMRHRGAYHFCATNSRGREEGSVTLLVYPDTDLSVIPTQEQTLSTMPIPVAEFGSYVASLHLGNNKKFREQFRQLATNEDGRTTTVACSDKNRAFNLSENAVVYDNNRICLQSLPQFIDCVHDYVNACFVSPSGKVEQKKIVAAQGPMNRTIVDMWRLIWQVKACAVVMLTSLQEEMKIKCAQYWPTQGFSDYGPFRVTLTSEKSTPHYSIREFHVMHNGVIARLKAKIPSRTKKEHYNSTVSTLRVVQFHFHGWPEHAPPASILALLDFHEQVTTLSEEMNAPVVVHCSSGIGRTGAYITLDHALKVAKTEEIVDIPAIVTTLRQQRKRMVQTLEQYIVIHDAVVEGALCGHTHIFATKLHDTIREMSQISRSDGAQVSRNTGKTGFQQQFTLLEGVSVTQETANCSIAQSHAQKNRSSEQLPADQWRVPLMAENPDYINANYVLGYNQQQSYIIAQSPLKDTRRDFWKMIFEREVPVIMMLCTTSEERKEVCSQYWPNEGNVEFGEYNVSVKEEWSQQGFVRRVFLVKDTKLGLARKVAQFQVLDWDPSGAASSPGNRMIVNTLNLVNAIQKKTPTSPIVVHCSDSVGRSAMFCAALVCWEQCKVEGKVDIFHIVRAMRKQRPGCITTVEQYKGIHEIVAAYLDLFTTDANYQSSLTA